MVDKRKFQFNLYKKRHVALQILYFGWQYDGLATQENSKNTIEHHLFEALIKTCMVESRANANYNRCGRTDKGVSSYGQVVSLDVRSNLIDADISSPLNIGLFTPEDYQGPPPHNPKSNRSFTKELDYADILNKVLPDHIRVIAWSPVQRSFSARFDCKQRSYRYIFPLGNLCIDSMSLALQHLIGEHDFRNLCTFDLKHGVTNHRRTIYSAKVQRIQDYTHHIDNLTPSEYNYYEVIIIGQAFLYHQIRCIMSILFLVGMKREEPDIMSDLLDVNNKCTSKPHYTMASSLPLTLFDCSYDISSMQTGWLYNSEALKNIIKDLKKLWFQYTTKSQMIESVLQDLSGFLLEKACTGSISTDDVRVELNSWTNFGIDCDRLGPNKYTKLLERTRGDTLEDRLEVLKTKKLKESHDSSTIDNS